MASAIVNNERVIKIGIHSWLNMCREEVVYDPELQAEVRFLGIFEDLGEVDIKYKNQEVEYVVEGRVRLDQLAKKYYGNELLWWVIAWRNNIVLPDADLYQGMTLVIPSVQFVRDIVLGR